MRERKEKKNPISINCTVSRSSYSRIQKILNIIIAEIFSNYFSISQSALHHSSLLLDVSSTGDIASDGLISLENGESNNM